MPTATGFTHWSMEKDRQQILHLILDRADSSQNSLSQAVLEELEQILTTIAARLPQAIVLRSGKERSFIVGADVSEFTRFQDSAAVARYIQRIHAIFQRLEDLPIPTLAVIDGPCLGGGLELALACKYRLAIDDTPTTIGFPEIKLGIHPGFGGTVRSMGKIGSLAALDLMLSGRALSARQALQQGLVDACVARRLQENAIVAILTDPPRQKKLPLSAKVAKMPMIRPLLSRILKRKVAAKASVAHYPAPYALIDLWRRHAGNSRKMYRAEAESIATLLCGETAQNLIRVFFLQTQLKAFGKKSQPIQRVHVIGAGTMGRDIAAWCALQGLQVSLQDLDRNVLGQAMVAADQLFRKKLKKDHLVRAAHDRLLADPDGLAISRADLIIEAIVEKLEIKRALLQQIEPQLKADAILASNTSSIPLEELAAGLAQPQRFLGIHFFNPVALMPLVEVVAAAESAATAIERATAFVKQIRHLPLPVKSAPGFLVNRVLMPYLLAAVKLVEQGVPAATIDRAALAFGMPMGPLALADKIGLDVCLSVATIFARYFEQPIPELLTSMVAKKTLGVKSGQGFYRYKNGKACRSVLSSTSDQHQQDLIEKLLTPLLDEAQACLDEGIVASAELVDAGMIFGTGFAPFSGGPLHYRQTQAATAKMQNN